MSASASLIDNHLSHQGILCCTTAVNSETLFKLNKYSELFSNADHLNRLYGHLENFLFFISVKKKYSEVNVCHRDRNQCFSFHISIS